jgi:hypothetical protein
MAHHTAKLGGANSDVVVGKIAVSSLILLVLTFPLIPTHGPRLSIAWAYDDDLEADTYTR